MIKQQILRQGRGRRLKSGPPERRRPREPDRYLAASSPGTAHCPVGHHSCDRSRLSQPAQITGNHIGSRLVSSAGRTPIRATGLRIRNVVVLHYRQRTVARSPARQLVLGAYDPEIFLRPEEFRPVTSGGPTRAR